MAITDLLTSPNATEAPPVQLGTISKAPASLGSSLQVKVPSFDPTGPFIYEIPAGRWMPRGERKPVLGDECLLVTDENGEPWLTAWEPAEAESEAPPPTVSEIVGCIVHGASKTKARPSGFPCVIWIGTVTPEHIATNDLYVNLTEATISVAT
jgi:hypothetical protein